MLSFGVFGINNDGAQHGRQRPDPRPHRHLGRAGLLDLRRRPPPDRRPDARRLRDGRVAVPVRGHDRLHDRPAAGVPRRRAPARAGDDGGRGAPGAARLPAVPALRLRGQGATTCAARAACASSRTRCYSCGKPIDPAGSCARTARPRSGARTPPSTRRRRRRPRRRTSRRSAHDSADRARADPRADHRPLRTERTHGADPDPGQARRLRARPDRRDHRPLRAQGPEDRRPQAHAGRPRTSPSSTTPSTTASRSSASSSSSSPPARSSRWCSRASRPSRPRAR